MKNFVIITDSCCDLPPDYIKNLNIPYVSLSYSYNGQELVDDFFQSSSHESFYESMKNGATPKTSQPSTHSFYENFKSILEKGKDVLYIGLSNGLSGTIAGANTAKLMLEDEFKDYHVHIVDVLTASLGQGLMVLKAIEMKSQGSTIHEIINYIESIKQKLNTYIIVDDINHVKRGGRISSAAAFVGTLLNIKPFLTINSLGKVSIIGKLRGRKKAINALLEKLKEKTENSEEQTIAISHGNCIEDAVALKNLILKTVQVKEVLINNIGPVVGCYGGPGALALFFIGKERD